MKSHWIRYAAESEARQLFSSNSKVAILQSAAVQMQLYINAPFSTSAAS